MYIFIFLFIFFFNFIKNENITILNKDESEHYDFIFNSINCDHFNISLIFNYSYNSIKIKHKSGKSANNRIPCILGVLANENGLKIENSMLEWLLPEYDVYCVYQKYPGIMFEYPALRFAQWLSLNYNKQIILYVHTKGAYYYNNFQDVVRLVWKHEFTKPYSKKYIRLIEENITDISLPFRNDFCTWYNGMFISYRAFNAIKEIPYYKDILRHYYECLTFKELKESSYIIRFKGVLIDKIESQEVLPITEVLAHYFDLTDNLRNNIIIIKFRRIMILNGILFLFFFLKIYLNLNRFNYYKVKYVLLGY